MENDEETKKRSHVNDNNTKDNWTASVIVTTITLKIHLLSHSTIVVLVLIVLPSPIL